MSGRDYEKCLPPRDLWPDLIFTRPEFAYPETLNAATELLDVHVSAGRGDRPAILFENQRISYAEL
jgi:2-aminobenzoate-CoA ligase